MDELDPSGNVSWGCIGSVISEYFILTAAHCIESQTPKSVSFDLSQINSRVLVLCSFFSLNLFLNHFRHALKYVRLGVLDYESDQDDVEARQFEVAEIFIHPLYDSFQFLNDIGLLRLEKPIEFSDYIRPACLTDVDTPVSDRFVVSAWGQTDYKGAFHSHLQRIQQIFVPLDKCDNFYTERIAGQWLENTTQICARAEENDPDLCSVNDILLTFG